MRSIFGWSYPPGCSGPPDDDEYPCEVCGEGLDNCICPECPICEDVGNRDCYINHGLRRTEEQKFSLESNNRWNDLENWKENEYWKNIVEDYT